MYIYGLIDPLTGQLKYIGKTKRSLKRRLTEHICVTNLISKTYKNHWIKQLLEKQHKPEIVELEKLSPNDDWIEAEQFWIAYMRFIGYKLTNLTDGGDGLCGATRETRYKCGSSRRGKKYTFTEDHKQKIAEANRERAKNTEWLENARKNLDKVRNKNGHSWKQESRNKISIIAKKKFSEMSAEDKLTFSSAGVKARIKKYKRKLNCFVCNAEFTAIDLKAKYCGVNCKQKDYRKKKRGINNV